MSRPFTILAFAGSLRIASYNRGLVRAAKELAPEGAQVEIIELDDIPMYNEDLRADGNPPSVERLRAAIRSADALLIATPEYNYSISGVLKNALDWVSRPAPDVVMKGKPTAIMGATGGMFGTVRAQMAFRQILTYTETHVLTKPEVLVMNARQRFDADGNLTDAETREWVRALVEALVVWARRLAPSTSRG